MYKTCKQIGVTPDTINKWERESNSYIEVIESAPKPLEDSNKGIENREGKQSVVLDNNPSYSITKKKTISFKQALQAQRELLSEQIEGVLVNHALLDDPKTTLSRIFYLKHANTLGNKYREGIQLTDDPQPLWFDKPPETKAIQEKRGGIPSGGGVDENK